MPADVSNHAQLAMNYLDAFADEIYSRYAEISWPEAVILDASPQRARHPYGTFVNDSTTNWVRHWAMASSGDGGVTSA